MKRERICLIIACLLSFALTTGIMERRMEAEDAGRGSVPLSCDRRKQQCEGSAD